MSSNENDLIKKAIESDDFEFFDLDSLDSIDGGSAPSGVRNESTESQNGDSIDSILVDINQAPSSDRKTSSISEKKEIVADSQKNQSVKSDKFSGLKGKINAKAGFGKIKESFRERFQDDDMGQWDDLSAGGASALSIDDFLKKDSVEKKTTEDINVAIESPKSVDKPISIESPVVPDFSISTESPVSNELSQSVKLPKSTTVEEMDLVQTNKDTVVDAVKLPAKSENKESVFAESIFEESAPAESAKSNLDDIGIELFDLDSIDSISEGEKTPTIVSKAKTGENASTTISKPDEKTSSSTNKANDESAKPEANAPIKSIFKHKKTSSIGGVNTALLSSSDDEDSTNGNAEPEIIDMSDAEPSFIERAKEKAVETAETIKEKALESKDSIKEKIPELIARIKGEKDEALHDDGTNKDRAKDGFGVWTDEDDEETKRLKRAERKRQETIKMIKIGAIALVLLILIIMVSSCISHKKDNKKIISDNTTKKENVFPGDKTPIEEIVSDNTVSDNTLSENSLSANMIEYTEEEIAIFIDEDILDRVENLSIKQKVAAMFFVTPEILLDSKKPVTSGDSNLGIALKQYPVGGVLFGEDNIEDAAQFKQLINYTKNSMNSGVFLAIKEDGDDNSAMASKELIDKSIPSPAEMEEANDGTTAYLAAFNISRTVARYNINLIMGPMTDVTSKSNAVNADESFGSDKDVVTDCTRYMVHAYSDEGLYNCAMTFPGYGDITSASTASIPTSSKTKAQLEKQECVIYKSAMYAGLDMVMVSGVKYTAIDSENPAFMSKAIVTDMLRDSMKFDGIIMTDFANQKYITSNYDAGEMAVKSILAGCDMIMCPGDLEEAYQGVLDAIDAGEIDEERIDESVYRIYYYLYSDKVHY